MTTLHTWTEGHTRWLEVRRPDALNAVNFALMDALAQAIHDVEEDPTITVVVLRGAGDKSFISGGDLKEFAHYPTAHDAEMMARRMREVLLSLERLPCWTIACINGAAYGGGCETLVACDFRFAASHAKLGWTQTRFALPCGWGGMTRLTELVGRSSAMLMLAEQQILSSFESLKHGLVDEVCDNEDALVERVRGFAARVGAQPRHVISALKTAGQNALRMSREDAMDAELGPFAACWEDRAHLDAVDAFLAKQKERRSRS